MTRNTISVIQTGGKQYKVRAGATLTVEKLEGQAGDKVVFDKVLLEGEGANVKIGTPYIEGAKVTGTITEQGRDKKKIIFRYHSKTRYRKLKGHRQPHTKVRVESL